MAVCERPFKITKCSNEHDRDWSSLPLDILRYIFSRLTIFDCYSFANVCISWRSAKAPLSPQTPFLLQHSIPEPFCKLLNLTDNLSSDIHMPILGSKVCIGSQYGWLILVDDMVHVVSLYNPFSQMEIKLPSHAHIVARMFCWKDSSFISKRFAFKKVVLSCSPISSTKRFLDAAATLSDSGDFMYKRYGEKCWNPLYTEIFQDITTWRGKFVGVTREGKVWKVDLDGSEPTKIECVGVGSYDYQTYNQYNKHLVTIGDNLLQVWRYMDSEGTVTVKVLQLDLQRLARDIHDLCWIPVDDLWGHSLFLSTSNSFALPSQHIPGLKDNLIYFIPEKWRLEYFVRPKRVSIQHEKWYLRDLHYSKLFISMFYFNILVQTSSECVVDPVILRIFFHVLWPTVISSLPL